MKSLIIFMAIVVSSVNAADFKIERIIEIESSGVHHAISPKGCVGMMQISRYALQDYNRIHGTDYTLLDDMKDPDINIKVGTWYINHLAKYVKKKGSQHVVTDALICYNWGMGRWKKWYENGRKYKDLPSETHIYLMRYRFNGDLKGWRWTGN